MPIESFQSRYAGSIAWRAPSLQIICSRRIGCGFSGSEAPVPGSCAGQGGEYAVMVSSAREYLPISVHPPSATRQTA